MASTSLKFYVNNQKLNAKKGTLPIYCRLINNKNKKEFRLPKTFDIKDSEINFWNSMTRRLNIRNHPTNEYLNALEYKFQKLLTYSPEMSLEDFINEIQNINSKKEAEPSLIDYIDKYLIEEIETPIRKEGTKKNYRNAFKQLKNYLKYQKLDKIKICDFTFKEAKGFKLYLEKEFEIFEKKGLLIKKIANQEVSSSTKIKNVKPVFKKAVFEGYLKSNPFENIKLNHRSVKSPPLSSCELRRIYQLELSHLPDLDQIKDIFLFMVYTGLSIIDIHSLSSEDLRETNGGRLMLDDKREKSKSQVRQIIIRPAETIIKKYVRVGRNTKGEKVFPIITSETINRKLKIIAVHANILINLSTKIARNTCRELLYESGIKEPLLINSYMGWSTSTKDKVKMQYLSITERKLLELSCELEIHIHNVLNGGQLVENELISRANALKWSP